MEHAIRQGSAEVLRPAKGAGLRMTGTVLTATGHGGLV
jgi:hypothetical protein